MTQAAHGDKLPSLCLRLCVRAGLSRALTRPRLGWSLCVYVQARDEKDKEGNRERGGEVAKAQGGYLSQ